MRKHYCIHVNSVKFVSAVFTQRTLNSLFIAGSVLLLFLLNDELNRWEKNTFAHGKLFLEKHYPHAVLSKHISKQGD